MQWWLYTVLYERKTKNLILFFPDEYKELIDKIKSSVIAASVWRLAFLPFFFFILPTPLALFMGHEQCIKAKLQYFQQ